jgi:hypothetical protein
MKFVNRIIYNFVVLFVSFNMMSKYECPECKLIFDSQGKKEEYVSAIYGPCFKYIADCPSCGTQSNEYRTPSKKQSSSSAPSCSGGGCRCCG